MENNLLTFKQWYHTKHLPDTNGETGYSARDIHEIEANEYGKYCFDQGRVEGIDTALRVASEKATSDFNPKK